jgi:hypothetical protein
VHEAGAERLEEAAFQSSASLGVYRNAYYDKGLLDRDIAQSLAEDGSTADHSCFLNDTRGLMPQQPDDEPETDPDAPREPLRTLLPRTTLSWPVEFAPRPNLTFALDALDAPGSIELSMTADGAILPRADIERFLYGIEHLVVGEAIALGFD